MSEPRSPEVPRKLDVFRPERDLSSFEHGVLIGSSWGGYDWARFKEEAAAGHVSSDALKPLGWEFPLDSRQTQNLMHVRENQKELKGVYAFLDEQIDELPSEYRVRLQPVGIIDATTGKIDPIWRLSIVDSDVNPIESQAFGNLMQLSEMHAPYFHLEDEGPGAKLLHLNDELQ